MWLSSIFRSPRIARFRPATSLPWLSGFASQLASVRFDRNDPFIIPLCASVALMLALALQFAMPNAPDVQTQTRLPRIAIVPPPAATNDYPRIPAAPIFAPDRKPERVAAGPVASDMVLLGVARSQQTTVALIKGGDGLPHRVGLGAAIDGWTLLSADATHAVLQRDGEEKTLDIVPGQPVPLSGTAAAPAGAAKSEDDNSDDQ